MPTFKVVVIGASGVGKTSLRGQYISSRFSTSYRATIGADFITKTLPPPASSPDAEPVTLQIWDTAGQERFSSLASAFFRGADAAVLMYDVTSPETLYALTKWWSEFKEKAPVAEEDLRGFCVCVVGNKVDLLLDGRGEGDVVSPAQGARFVRALVPRPDTPPPSPGPSASSLILSADEDEEDDEDADDALASSELTARPAPVTQSHQTPPSPISILRHPHLAPSPTTPSHNRHTKSNSQISFSPAFPGGLNLNRSRSRSQTRAGAASRASTITSTLTVYHTPSSSVFSDGASEYFHSAQSSFRESYASARGHGRGDSDSTVHSDSTLHSSSNANSNTNSNLHSHSNSQTGVEYPHALGNGLPTALASRLHANGNGSAGGSPSQRSTSEATITPARFSSASSASSTHSSTDSFPLSSSPSPPPTRAPGAWHSRDSSAATTTTTTSGLRSKSASPPPPPPIDTTTNGTVDAGPSSSALSPLPYPQHFPLGAALLNLNGNGNANGSGNGGFAAFGLAPPTTAVAREGAGSSVDSLEVPDAAAPNAVNGVNGVNGNASSKPATNGVVKPKPRNRLPRLPSSSSASSAPPPPDKWVMEPDLPHLDASGAAHFRVSARTGEGVGDVFGWVGRRLVLEWERREGRFEVDDGGMSKHDRKKSRGSRGGAEERLRLNAGGGAGANVGEKAGCC